MIELVENLADTFQILGSVCIFLLGAAVGWLTKVPWMYKLYQKYQKEKETNRRFREFRIREELNKRL